MILGLYLIWLQVAPKSGIGTPRIISGGVFGGIVVPITDDMMAKNICGSYYCMNNEAMRVEKRANFIILALQIIFGYERSSIAYTIYYTIMMC